MSDATPPVPGGTGRRIYTGVWTILVNWFKVPTEPPALPAAPGETVDRFRPATGFLGYLRFWFWLVAAIVSAAAMVGLLVLAVVMWPLALALLPVVALFLLVPLVLAFLAIHLRFDTTWYVMSERSLRIRRGIWIIHEMTITFENVQNVKVSQGPLQRVFGISDLVVETAGGGGGGGQSGHHAIANRGVIEGITDAAARRDLILARLRATASAGLGDESEGSGGPGRWTPAHLEALREILHALRSP